jgi:hypothetical protein
LSEGFLHWILCKGHRRREFGDLNGPFRQVYGPGGGTPYGFCKEALCFLGFGEMEMRQVRSFQWLAARIVMALELGATDGGQWSVVSGQWSVVRAYECALGPDSRPWEEYALKAGNNRQSREGNFASGSTLNRSRNLTSAAALGGRSLPIKHGHIVRHSSEHFRKLCRP